MVSSSQIRQRLAHYLDGEISLATFEDWFVQNTWNIHLGGSVSAEELTFAIEESLSEYSSDHISEHQLRNELADLIQRENMVLAVRNAPSIVWKVSSLPVTSLQPVSLRTRQ